MLPKKSLPPQGCTIFFECDIRQFKGNPFHVETPFGRPVTIAVGDVFEERDRLEDELEQTERYLEDHSEARTG